MPVIRTKVVEPPARARHKNPDRNKGEPPTGEDIAVVLRLGKWDFRQLIHNRIDDESKARLEENGYRYSFRLQKWWKPAAHVELSS